MASQNETLDQTASEPTNSTETVEPTISTLESISKVCIKIAKDTLLPLYEKAKSDDSYPIEQIKLYCDKHDVVVETSTIKIAFEKALDKNTKLPQQVIQCCKAVKSRS